MTTEGFKTLCLKRREQLAWRCGIWTVLFSTCAIALSFGGDGRGTGFLVTGIFATWGLSTFADATFREIEEAALNIGEPDEDKTFADITREVVH